MPANVVVPEVGESIVDARVAKWLKKEGDSVSVGEPLVELETDKIDLEVAAPQGGVLAKIAHADGADVKVGEVLGVIEDSTTTAEAAKRPSPAEAAPAAKAEGSGKLETGKQRATPAARNVAQQNEVDLGKVQGSGEAGRVMKRDVEAVAQPAPRSEPPAAKPAPAATTPAADKHLKPATPIREDRRTEGDRTDERVRMSKRRA